MDQPDLFGEARAPVWTPDPEKVRRRLTRILDETRRAEALEPARLSLFRAIVPDMTRWLPEEEGARWRADFAEAAARFERA